MTDRWRDWWRRRGEERLSLLLWALWNPIGPVPLDEYESYAGNVAAILEKARLAGEKLIATSGGDFSDVVQLQRNALRHTAEEELVNVLGELSDQQMGTPPNVARDRQAAQILLDWYEWEMDAPQDDS